MNDIQTIQRKRFFILLFLFAVAFPVSYAQNKDFSHGDWYFYDGVLGGKKHNERFQVSWLIPGISERNMLHDMDFSSEDCFIYSFNELTYYIEYKEYGFMRLMQEWNDYDHSSHWDSIYWDVKHIIDAVDVPEYKIVLGDSTDLYLKIYKLNGEYWKNKRIALSSRNPYYDKYYKDYKLKGMYTLINLYSAKGVAIKKRHRKKLKGALSCVPQN
ncbi:MAG: hypothetical protein J5616_08945 [Bacteroidaceae bacterium]|nr:hypothetical protein [Bacteroidaceae bacterium]